MKKWFHIPPEELDDIEVLRAKYVIVSGMISLAKRLQDTEVEVRVKPGMQWLKPYTDTKPHKTYEIILNGEPSGWGWVEDILFDDPQNTQLEVI